MVYKLRKGFNENYMTRHLSLVQKQIQKDNPLFQQTRYIDQMSVYCWTSVEDNGPTLSRHWINVLCMLGYVV